MKNKFQQIISDVDGKGSSTRITMFVILLLICVITLGVTFFNAYFNKDIWSDLFWALLLFGGMIKSEKFTNRTPDLTNNICEKNKEE